MRELKNLEEKKFLSSSKPNSDLLTETKGKNNSYINIK
jgi:hypothetical protein